MAPRDIINDPNALEVYKRKVRQVMQRYLDASVPHRSLRWALFGMLLVLYCLRIFVAGGFYIITYGMFIHLLFHFILMITPLAELDESTGTGEPSTLPTSNAGDDDFRPFVPKVQEFVAWKTMTTVVLVCLFLTLFRFLDIPVFWPILVLYFIVLVLTQLSGRIRHMVKHRYVPWSTGKTKYVAKKTQGK